MASKDQAGKDQAESTDGLIGGNYVVDVSRPLPFCGSRAFTVRDRRGGDVPDLMAVMVSKTAPPRGNVLSALAWDRPAGLLAPVVLGVAPGPDGREQQFVIGQMPPSRALTAWPEEWQESEIIDGVLRPAAAALEALRTRRLTHRAIRPDNLFRAASGAPAVLGPFWAEPPASLQPAIYEPPYMAMCPPAGRGDGTIADDVYALGVVLLVLATGRVPLADVDDATIIRQKLELGSYPALVGGARLPSMIADLLRGMLAEDPDHRPPPSLLGDPARARARRVAARPPRRAARPLEFGTVPVLDTRTLAWAIARDPETGARLLHSGVIVLWIRRSIGDAAVGSKLEEVVRHHGSGGGERSSSNAVLAMQAVSLLDPLAPLCWRGLALWPDAFGPLLVGEESERHGRLLEEIFTDEILVPWVATRGVSDLNAARLEARQHRAMLREPGWNGGIPRLRYALNPLLPCTSPLLDGRVVTRVAELLPALEANAGAARPSDRPIDPEICAMVAARQESHAASDVTIFQGLDPGKAILAMLRLLSGIQTRHAANATFPRLCAWLARYAEPLVESWRSPARRTKFAKDLAAVAEQGRLPDMLALLDDAAARVADQKEAEAAESAVKTIDEELTRITAESEQRAALAKRLGAEFAAAISAVVLVGVFLGMVVF